MHAQPDHFTYGWFSSVDDRAAAGQALCHRPSETFGQNRQQQGASHAVERITHGVVNATCELHAAGGTHCHQKRAPVQGRAPDLTHHPSGQHGPPVYLAALYAVGVQGQDARLILVLLPTTHMQ
jgi:hypothetical protein